MPFALRKRSNLCKWKLLIWPPIQQPEKTTFASLQRPKLKHDLYVSQNQACFSCANSSKADPANLKVSGTQTEHVCWTENQASSRDTRTQAVRGCDDKCSVPVGVTLTQHNVRSMDFQSCYVLKEHYLHPSHHPTCKQKLRYVEEWTVVPPPKTNPQTKPVEPLVAP